MTVASFSDGKPTVSSAELIPIMSYIQNLVNLKLCDYNSLVFYQNVQLTIFWKRKVLTRTPRLTSKLDF